MPSGSPTRYTHGSMSQTHGPTTLILGALEEEIAAFLELLRARVDQAWNGFRFHCGTLQGSEVVVSRSGVGKSLSAAVTQHLIDRYSPARLLLTGLAGAIAPQLEVGDTLVARDCLQYDLDATALGFKLGEIPYTPYRILESDPALLTAALGYRPRRGRLHSGRILTGDRFLVSAGAQRYGYLRSELLGDAVEMEGASVALVARLNGVPFLIVRTISDCADGKPGGNLRAILADVSRNSLACVQHVLAAVGAAA